MSEQLGYTQQATRRARPHAIALLRILTGWLAPAVLTLVLPAAAAAQSINCTPAEQPLVKIPELVTQSGMLKGTLVLNAERQRLIFRLPQLNGKAVRPGNPAATYQCQQQVVRAFRIWQPGQTESDAIRDPQPGPTLRARVGDIVELTFVNQVEANRFPYSIDQGDKRNQLGGVAQNPANGCDIINVGTAGMGYPYTGPQPFTFGDKFPDCFHGSSTGNLHFHGTHTNTTGTGDNVFLEIRPSPRVPKPGSTRGETIPTITPAAAEETFKPFFAECEKQMKANVRSEWPMTWDQPPLGPWKTPGTWTADQAKLLQDYDTQTKQDLWPANLKLIGEDKWPQYYIGSFPYCFQLPLYPYTSWPPPPGGIQMGQSPGTHWYHAHKHGSTAIDVANGMVGAFIIEGKYDDDLNTFYGPGWTRTQPVMVINQLGVSPNLMRSAGAGAGQQDKGPDFTVNGQSRPVVGMAPGEVQLWRIVNASGRSGAYLAGFPPGFNWRQIAQDGVQFADENYKASQNQPFLIAAGNRVDLLVQAPSPGTYAVQVQHEVDPSDLPTAAPVVLLQVRVRADVPPASNNRAAFIPTAPTQPPFLTNITDAEVASTIKNPREIRFKSTPPPGQKDPNFAQHTINGHKFDDADDKPFPVTLDAVEEWKIINETYGPEIAHPFHIHLNPFQIVEVFDPNAKVTTTNGNGIQPKYVSDEKQLLDKTVQCLLNLADQSTWFDCHNNPGNGPRIWWDVFPIPSGALMGPQNSQVPVPGYFRMRSRFVDFPGQYVMHCHILAHEDRGMMAAISLQPANTPQAQLLYRHH
jgi:FtsP/CotA-like multicopper oxidase with cupredoxin domain